MIIMVVSAGRRAGYDFRIHLCTGENCGLRRENSADLDLAKI